jgi:hypothetical protein
MKIYPPVLLLILKDSLNGTMSHDLQIWNNSKQLWIYNNQTVKLKIVIFITSTYIA